MPLEPVPPPSTVGKPNPPPKHQCDCSNATRCCDIPISQIGRQFHYIPKAFLDTVFFPPAVPAWVLRYLKAHPPTWTWKLRAGPRAGTVLTVPTVPIHCPSDAHRAIKWLVSTFHSFKGSLRKETALSAEGKVHPPLVRVYQNNMLLHISAQSWLLDRAQPPKPAPKDAPQPRQPPTRTAPAPPTQHASCSAKITALWAEIEALRKKLAEVFDTTPPSPRTAITVVPPAPRHDPPSPTSSVATAASCTAHPDHPWLQTILDHSQCPPFLQSVDLSMVPIATYAIPNDVQQVVQTLHSRSPPIYVGIDSNGDLMVAKTAPGDLVTIAIRMPSEEWNNPFSAPAPA